MLGSGPLACLLLLAYLLQLGLSTEDCKSN